MGLLLSKDHQRRKRFPPTLRLSTTIPPRGGASTPGNQTRQSGHPISRGSPKPAWPIAASGPRRPDVTSGAIKLARHLDVSLLPLGRPVPGANSSDFGLRPRESGGRPMRTALRGPGPMRRARGGARGRRVGRVAAVAARGLAARSI